MLYDIIVAPIEMIVDWVFLFSTSYMAVLGVMGAIVCVSVSINFLTLPIYNVADKIQENERNIQKKLAPWVAHIKRTFKGDERFMMLQTYYREEGYSPIYALRSSISVLIQIPFFMAAYHYLSNNELLQEGGFLFIENLGKPDALFSVGGFSINVLPIFMTLINVVSGIVYTKGFPVREKVQVYGLAAVFLVLLYNSPSGLVLYWIMNNVFSLCKNFVKKTKNPVRTTVLAVCILLLAVLIMSVIVNPESFGWKKQFLLLFVAVCIAATLFSSKAIAILKNKFALGRKCVFAYTPPPYTHTYTNSKQKDKTNFFLFLSSAIGLALLAGFLLPSSVIATSPTEFSFLGQTESPLSYIYTSACVFAGFFILWPVVIYKMFSGKVRKVMPPLFFVAFVCALLNAYVFKHDYGTLNAAFVLDKERVLEVGGRFLALSSFLPVIFCIAIYISSLRYKFSKILCGIVFSVCFAEIAYGIYRTNYAAHEFKIYSKQTYDERAAQQNKIANADSTKIKSVYHLNPNGKNVVILFFDRAVGNFLPYIFEQLPYLRQKYSGFTAFPNTAGNGSATLLSVAAMLGGYEYTLDNLNARPNELLSEKINKASLLLPTLFSEADFDVTLTDPFVFDSSKGFEIFDNLKNTKVSKEMGKYFLEFVNEKNIVFTNQVDQNTKYGIKNFSVLQIIFPHFRKKFYAVTKTKSTENEQKFFAENFSNLYYFDKLTDFSSNKNTFTFIKNNTTHAPAFLNAPEFNSFAEKSLDGCGMYKPKSDIDVTHYHVNAAMFLALANWLDFLRRNNCYDNMRIILVADHGWWINFKEFEEFEDNMFPAVHNPLLLFKDFDSHGDLKIDYSFMTNADTIFLAKKDLPVSDINPFTHKKLTTQKDDGFNMYPVSGSNDLPEREPTNMKNRATFTLQNGWHVRDSIFDKENWTRIENIKE